ncbi:hypothetical protein GALL_444050 [mine drainage metagenome]|uniref:Uncharacterized protein n=1 Tax=mine drainage metagenome TaxID=410659 RepID=A0A1J5PS42_9ZZZZ
MKHVLGRTVALTSAVLLAVGVSSPANASDDSGKLTSVGPVSQSNFRSPVVRLHPGVSSGVTPQVTGSGGQIVGYSGVTITPPGGTSGTFAQGFTSYYTAGSGLTSAYINVTSGSSYARWYGATPYNADSIGLSNSVWVGGLGVSISVGGSSGVGISVSNDTVTMSNSVANTWRNEHSFTNIDFSTALAIWGPYENSSDSATFSYQTFYDNIS